MAHEFSWNSFEYREVLGQGSFGTVYRAKHRGRWTTFKKIYMYWFTDWHKWFVVKVIDTTIMTEEQSLKAIEEVNLQGRWDSPYIVKYYDSFLDDQGRINIVMEYWDNGDLHSYLQKQKSYLSETNVWKIFVQIGLGLHHLHSQNVLHRDLKALNVFIGSDFKIKIGDLGSATENKEDNGADGKLKILNLAVGTPYYFSPELWRGEKYTIKCDIWALGWILYEICSLKKPFEGKDYDELSENIRNGSYDKIPDLYSSKLSNLVDKMLKMNPEERPSIDEIVDLKMFKNQSIIMRLLTPVNFEKSSK